MSISRMTLQSLVRFFPAHGQVVGENPIYPWDFSRSLEISRLVCATLALDRSFAPSTAHLLRPWSNQRKIPHHECTLCDSLYSAPSPSTERRPIIFVSGLISLEDDAASPGFDGYVGKVFQSRITLQRQSTPPENTRAYIFQLVPPFTGEQVRRFLLSLSGKASLSTSAILSLAAFLAIRPEIRALPDLVSKAYIGD